MNSNPAKRSRWHRIFAEIAQRGQTLISDADNADGILAPDPTWLKRCLGDVV